MSSAENAAPFMLVVTAPNEGEADAALGWLRHVGVDIDAGFGVVPMPDGRMVVRGMISPGVVPVVESDERVMMYPDLGMGDLGAIETGNGPDTA